MSQPTDQLQGEFYTDGVPVENEYRIDPGVCVLPIAQEPPTSPSELQSWSPVVVLRLHAPYRLRRVRYTSKKQQNPPIIPKPADVGAFVFVGGSLGFQTSLNLSLSSYDWLAVTDYTFVEDCVSRNQDGFVLGVGPWTTFTTVENSRFFGGALEVGNAISGNGSLGAIGQAGPDAQIGYRMGKQAALFIARNEGWGYNTPSFFPGDFLNGAMVNAGGETSLAQTGGSEDDS